MSAELGKAYVQIVPSAQGISGSISSVIEPEATSAGQKAGLNIAGGIGSALKGATSLLAAGTAAVTGAIVKGSSEVASYGDNIDKMSQKMGLTAQAYQEWDAVMQHSGTSMETMKSSMKTLANAAESGNKAFETLGISQKEIAKMSQQDLFEATIAGLQNVEDTTQRTYLAGQLLGRGATELGALLNTSAADTQAMRDRVKELGGVMSDDAVKAAATYQDNMQDLKTAMGGVGREMISQLLPSMNEIIAGFTSLIIGEEGATEKLSSGFGQLFTNLDGIAKNIVSTITGMMPNIINGISEILPELINMAATLITSLAQALVAAMPELLTTVLPALLESAINIIVAFGQALIEAAPQLVEAGKQLFEMLKETFSGSDMLDKGMETVQGVMDGITEALPGLLESGVEIITELVTGILNNLPQLIETAGQLITNFATFILNNLPTILSAGSQMLLNLVNGIIKNLPQIVSSVVKVIAQFIATIGQNLPKILQEGYTIIGQLAAGLIKAIPEVIKSIPKIIKSIVDTFTSYNWLKIGVNILEGIKDGMFNALSSVINAAKEAAEGIMNGIKDFFDIASPSKKMRWVGEMIDAGLAGGIEDNQDMITDALDDVNTDLAAQLQLSTGFGDLQTSDNKSGGIIVNMTINGAVGQDVEALAEIVQQKLMIAIGRNEAVYA